MSIRKINKIDKEGNVIKTYATAKEAAIQEKVKYDNFLYAVKNKNYIRGFVFVYGEDKKPGKVITQCDNCDTEFLCHTWRLKSRTNIFCSKKCEGEYRKKQSVKNCICDECGREFHRKKSNFGKSEHTWCSKRCEKLGRSKMMTGKGNHQYGLLGRDNASWKSDEKISGYGYKLVRDLTHPFKNCDGFVFEHRLVAEKLLLSKEVSIEINGHSYLHPDYIVHHKDFNRLNNTVTNLLIMERGEHMKLHWKLKIEDKLKKCCNDHQLGYINVSRNGGLGSTSGDQNENL